MSYSDRALEARLYGGEAPTPQPHEPLRCEVCKQVVLSRSLFDTTGGEVWAGPCCESVCREAARLESDVRKDEAAWTRAFGLTSPIDAFAGETL
jgi:hypothetical protein